MTWQRIGEVTPAFHAKPRKRVPHGMIREYAALGWVVVDRHDTYVTMEKMGGGE